MINNKKIIVILPAYNEENKIGKVVSKLKTDAPKEYVDLIIVVDDGSTDNTVKEAQLAGAEVLIKQKNEGVGSAIRTGIKYAQKNNFDIIVVMAGDDQDVPKELPIVVNPIIYDKFDFVQGSRRLYQKQVINIPLFRRITTKLYSWIFKIITGFPCTDGTNGFRAFTLEFTKDKRMNIEQDWLNTYELEPYLFYNAIKLGYRVKEVQVTKVYFKAVIGYTKMVPFKDWWNILKPLLYLKFKIRK